MRYLIVNADDLGASPGVNRGILEAASDGIVTSASLMVDMPAADEFAAQRHEVPLLSVGMHATFTDEGGEMRIEPQGCRQELERQLDRFEALLGRAPTHLDSHHNVHLTIPEVAQVFAEVAASCAVPLRGRSPARYYADFYGQWDDGSTHLDLVSVERLEEILQREVGSGVTELSCHPGYPGDGFGSSYLIEREAELRTLCDPRARALVQELGIQLISFSELTQAAAAAEA